MGQAWPAITRPAVCRLHDRRSRVRIEPPARIQSWSPRLESRRRRNSQRREPGRKKPRRCSGRRLDVDDQAVVGRTRASSAAHQGSGGLATDGRVAVIPGGPAGLEPASWTSRNSHRSRREPARSALVTPRGRAACQVGLRPEVDEQIAARAARSASRILVLVHAACNRLRACQHDKVRGRAVHRVGRFSSVQCSMTAFHERALRRRGSTAAVGEATWPDLRTFRAGHRPHGLQRLLARPLASRAGRERVRLRARPADRPSNFVASRVAGSSQRTFRADIRDRAAWSGRSATADRTSSSTWPPRASSSRATRNPRRRSP